MINVNSYHKISHFCTTQLWEEQKYFSPEVMEMIFSPYSRGKYKMFQEENIYLLKEKGFFVLLRQDKDIFRIFRIKLADIESLYLI